MSGLAQNYKLPDFTEVTDHERQFQNVNVTVFGRYMLSNKQEFPCQITMVSPGAATIIAPKSGDINERVITYVDHLGRLEGNVLRMFNGGFVTSIIATRKKREKLAATITWLANRHELNLPEDRAHDRLKPTSQMAQIKLEDGRTYNARIIDLSLSGAAIEMDVRPAIGTLIWISNMRGRVVRHFENGVALEFSILQTHDSLREFSEQ